MKAYLNPSTNHNLSENSNHPRTFYAVDNVALHFSFFAPQPDMHVFSLADFLDDRAPNVYRDAAFETALDAASYVLNSLLLSVEGVFVFSEWAFFMSPRNFFMTDERLFIYLVPTTFLPFIFEQKHDINSPLPHSVLKRQFTYVARMLSIRKYHSFESSRSHACICILVLPSCVFIHLIVLMWLVVACCTTKGFIAFIFLENHFHEWAMGLRVR